MHAYGLENLLQPIENAKNEGRVPQILDVGCGSGYLLGKVFLGTFLAFNQTKYISNVVKNIFSENIIRIPSKTFQAHFQEFMKVEL